MRQSSIKILVFLSAVVITGLACNTILGGGPAPSPTPEQAIRTMDDATPTLPPTEPPTAEPPTEPPPDTETPTAIDSGPGPDTFGLNAGNLYGEPVLFNSYRTTIEFSFSGTGDDGNLVEGSIMGEGSRIVEPPATSITFMSEGFAELGQDATYLFTQIEGTDYVVAPDLGCATLSTGGFVTIDLYSMLLAEGGMLGQLEGARRVLPNENINGVDVYHFTFDESALDQSDLSINQVSDIEGHLYVAPEGYVVRLLIDGVGRSELLTGDPDLAGNLHYELNYFDFDAPVEISPPAECAELGSDFPMLADAFNISAFSGLLTYSTNTEFDAVVNFYKQEMPVNGWTLTEEFIFGPAATLSFDKDGSSALVTIGEDPNSDAVLVALVEDSS